MKINRIVMLCISLAMGISVYGQRKEVWKVIDVRNTYLEIGVLKPAIQNFSSTQRQYLNTIFLIKDSVIFFPGKLKKTESFADSIFIRASHTFPRLKDTDLSSKYPGDELNCSAADSSRCYIGDSFMHLLGHKGKSLTFYDVISKYPNFYHYKLCEIEKDKSIGLLLQNSFVLLILKRIESGR